MVGTYIRRSAAAGPDLTQVPLDLTAKDQTWRTLKSWKPTAVLHLAAHAGTNHCEENPEETARLNVAATADLAEMCADRHIRFIFTSSEQVFDGRGAPYRESDEPIPGNEYGRQKLAAEKLVSAIHPDSIIVRLAVLFGYGIDPGGSAACFLDQWVSAWLSFLPVTAFRDEVRSFVSADCAARGLLRLLEQDASGTFHLGGDVPMSRHEFAVLAKKHFQFPNAVVLSKSQAEVTMPAFRPPDLRLDTGKLASLGFRPEDPAFVLRQLAGSVPPAPHFHEN